MSEVEEIEMRIRNLPSEDQVRLRDWFYDFDNDLWDRQIQSDFTAGKFTTLIQEARKEFSDGKVREL